MPFHRETKMTEEINLSTLFVEAAKYLKKNLLLLIALMAVGSVIGYAYFLIKTPVFQSEAVFQSSLLKPQDVDNIIGHLNNSIKYGSRDTQFTDWIKLEMEQPENSSNKSEFSKNYLTIRLTSQNQEAFTNASKTLEDHFSNITELKKLEANSSEILNDYSKRLKQQLNKKYNSENSSLTIQELKLEQNSRLDELAFVDLTVKELSILSVVEPFYTPKGRHENFILFVLVGAILTTIIGIAVKAIWSV